MSQLQSDKLFSKDFLILFAINFTSYAGLQMFSAIMPKFAASIGFPEQSLGLVVSVYALMIFVTSVFSGPLIDRINKKTILIAAMAGQSVAVLGYALWSKSLVLLIVLRLFHGLCSGVIMSVSMSMVASALPKTKLGAGMGIYGLGQTLAMAVGPSIGIFLVSSVGYTNMFLIAFAIVTLAALMTLFVFNLPILGRHGKGLSLKDMILVRAIPISLVGLFNNTAYSTISAYLIIHASQRGIENIGVFFTVYAAVLLASRPLVGRISDKIPFRLLIYPTSLLQVAAILLIAYAGSLWHFLVAAAVLGIGFGGSQPVIQAACIRDVPADRRGAASATFMMGQSMGFIIGPMAGSIIAATAGYGGMFTIMSGVALLSVVAMLFSAKAQAARASSSLPSSPENKTIEGERMIE